MRFSIIVPIYNIERFLYKCIDSVLIQNYKNFELILVDDGSTDNCPGICDTFAQHDSRVKVIHKTNGGLVSARKAGAKIAEGDYLIALDGDDWLEASCLEKLNQTIEANNVDLVRFGYYIAENEDDKIPVPIRLFYGYYNRSRIEKEIFPYLIYGSNGLRFPHSVWGGCVKRSLYCIEQLAVDDNIKIGEDAAVMRPIVYKAQSIYVMKDCMYCYRRNMASMTKERKPFSMKNVSLVAEHYINRINIKEYDFQNQLFCSVVHNFFLVAVTQFWQKKSYLKIRKEILAVLNENIIRTSVKKAKFGMSIRHILMNLVLRYRIVPIMWLYSQIKRL